MPKFIKQVRKFLNNPPFKLNGAAAKPSVLKMYKNPPLKGMQDPGGQKKEEVKKNRTNTTYNQAWNKMSEEKRKTFGNKEGFVKKAEDWWAKQDATKAATKPIVLDPVTVTADRIQNRKPMPELMTSDIKKPGDKTIKKITKEESAANAKRTKNKMIADKAKAAMDKKKAAAATQEQRMKDKIKLKQEIKDLKETGTRKKRKENLNTTRSTKQEAGQSLTDQDLIKKKREEKRNKRRAIRKYKRDPNALEVAKVKKDKNSPAKKYTSNAQRKAVHASKAEKNSAMKMYKSTKSPNKFNAGLKKAAAAGKLDKNPKFKAAVEKSPTKMKNKNSPAKNYKKGYYGIK